MTHRVHTAHIPTDHRCWIRRGYIRTVDGEDDLYFIDDDRQAWVSVEFASGGHTWALLSPFPGSYGMFAIPTEGVEAAVAFPEGDHLGDPFVVGMSAAVPTDLQPGRTIIIGTDVLIYDEDGATTDSLVTKTEFEAHVHGTGTGPSSTPTAPISGTQVLKAK